MNKIPMVSHAGQVLEIKNGKAVVKILSKSACASCQVNAFCPASESTEKLIHAFPSQEMEPGDEVTVHMEERLGWIAVFYAFLLPFVILLSVLFTASGLGFKEFEAAAFAMVSLLIYYPVLYFFRRGIDKKFVFTAEKRITN